jgi:hypothetical protein
MSSRSRTPVAYLCIAVVVLAAFLPGVSAFDYAVPAPQFALLPDLAVVADLPLAIPGNERPSSLLSLVSPRAPPRLALA